MNTTILLTMLAACMFTYLLIGITGAVEEVRKYGSPTFSETFTKPGYVMFTGTVLFFWILATVFFVFFQTLFLAPGKMTDLVMSLSFPALVPVSFFIVRPFILFLAKKLPEYAWFEKERKLKRT